jgi:uncharacterized protein (TIGR03437 family)
MMGKKTENTRWVALLLAAGIATTAWGQGGGTAPTGTSSGGSASSSSSVTFYGTYKLDGGTATQSNQTYTATAADTSAIWVTNSGVLTLVSPTITTSGDTSSSDNSSFYGLNAALLVNAAGSATVTGGTITTTGKSGNGAFSTGTGSTLSLSNVTIKASADGGHGVMATAGGTMMMSNVDITTSGQSSSAIATDRGSGTITVTGGTVTTSGYNSAGIYSTGVITVSGGTFKATGAEAAVIEGGNTIVLTNTSLTTTKEKYGVLIYQSMSGDAEGTDGTFTMTGGSINYTPTAGPIFYVTNSAATITLKGVAITGNSGVLAKASLDSWGTTGSNGGTVIMSGDAQTLTGSLVADSISSLNLTLKNSSTLTGAINEANTAKAANLTLDATSTWTVTANSYLTALSDSAGVSGTSITNIVGNGFTVYYSSGATANSYLGGKTYTLSGGGTLTPAGSSSTTTTTTPAIKTGGVTNAASGVAGVAPSAWVTIYGTNFTTSTLSATTSDLVSGYLPTTLGGVSVTVGGKVAYLNYVSPTQLNIQAPSDIGTGDVTVTVTNTTGSASATAASTTTLPGLFVSSNYVLAVRYSDSAIIDGVGGTASGYTAAAAANPGDILSIYATGLGTTTTAVAAGLVFSGAYATTTLPTVTIGGTTVDVAYSGLVGAGLYQINLTVPASLASGTYPVIVTQGGVSSPSTAILKVATTN